MLLGMEIKFYCDHKNLGFDTFRSERVRRWRSTLEEFDYTFAYLPGKNNDIADMLSRYPISEVKSSALEQITSIDTEDLFPIDFRKIAAARIKNKGLQNKPQPGKYQLKKIDRIDLITRDEKFVLTYDIFMQILAWYHLHLNHPGTTRTYHSLASQFYILNMGALVRAYIAKCAICKKHINTITTSTANFLYLM